MRAGAHAHDHARPRSRVRFVASAMLVASFAAALAFATDVGNAASSNVTVSLSVASATSIDDSLCQPSTTGITSFGTVLPGTPAVTTGNCRITFSSSNDTSQVRISQSDGAGRAMWRPAHGPGDVTFDSDGLLRQDFRVGDDDSIRDVLVQPDGKIVVVGSRHVGANDEDWIVARFTTSGTLDPAFNGGAMLVIDMLADDMAFRAALQPDGKIVVVGDARTAGGGDRRIGIARINPNGTLDSAFDADGKLVYSLGGWSEMRGVAVQTDGRIVVAGSYADTSISVARFTATGAIDTSFSGDGRWEYDPSASNDWGGEVLQQPDGKLVVAGYSGGGDPYVIRFGLDGTPDPTFDGDGIATIALAGSDYTPSLSIQRDGKLVLAGMGAPTGTNRFQVIRFTTGGAADTTFDGDGVATMAVGSGAARGEDAYVQPDGRIVVAGTALSGADQQLAIGRFTSTGTVDSEFDGDGWRLYPAPGSGAETLLGIAEGDDGVPWAVGQESSAGTYSSVVLRLETTTIPDYDDAGGSDWATAGANHFGACLFAVTSAVADWADSVACAAVDGPDWRGIGSTSTKIAHTTTAGGIGSVDVRFGLRTLASQPPGTYVAPISFDVLAPDA